jgi:putative phosphoribosyl transferase
VAHRVVPARPDLDQYRKQAKELLAGLAKAIPQAWERARQHHPRLQQLDAASSAGIKLADAQLVIAREHGFDSWPKFSGHLRRLPGRPPDAFEARIAAGNVELPAEVAGHRDAAAVVLFLLAGNIGRHHAGTRQLAAALNRASFCTVLADLLTEDEDVEDAIQEELRYDIRKLADRAIAMVDWLVSDARFRSLRIGLLCSGTGAAAGGIVALERPAAIRALVCVAGRPDLAGAWYARGGTPALFVVGGDDTVGVGFTRFVSGILPPQVPRRLEIIDGVGDRFDAGPANMRAAEISAAWFLEHLEANAGTEVGA